MIERVKLAAFVSELTDIAAKAQQEFDPERLAQRIGELRQVRAFQPALDLPSVREKTELLRKAYRQAVEKRNG